MGIKGHVRRTLLLSALTLSSTGVFAQSTNQSSAATPGSTTALEEVVVTARKREETAISVPVDVTVFGKNEIQQRAMNSLDDLSALVPSLIIANPGGATQGGQISLRGIGGPDSNPFGDQSVSFNVDDVQIAKSSVRRLASFDTDQIEVLKGPQALFFGKDSPAGIISLHTADPTQDYAAQLSSGYEFYAHETRIEGFVSGPLADSLGARVAFYGENMRGWVQNIVPDTAEFAPANQWLPDSREFGVRTTLKWEPNDRFTARLKVTYGSTSGAGQGSYQYVFCPSGRPEEAGVNDECKANSLISHADFGTSFTKYNPAFGNGVPHSDGNQYLAGLVLQYKVTDHLDFTSVTGVYGVRYFNVDQYTSGSPTAPIPYLGLPLLPAVSTYFDRELSQEIRLQSSFDGPLNFTTGAFFQNTHANTSNNAMADPENPIDFSDYNLVQNGNASSVFAQGRWNVVPTVEVDLGGRYSHEEKKLPQVLANPTLAPGAPLVPVTITPTSESFNDFSPEGTVSWRPSQDLTVFGSYKRAFLSGGFNSGSFSLTEPLNYGPEKIKGFEGGVKAALLDGTLRTNLSVYDYIVDGLQVPSFANAFETVRNAGKVSIRGVDFDFNYRTPIPALIVRGGATYERGRYLEYLGPCYAGQTPAMGCSLMLNGGAVQNLSNTQLLNAPTWTGSAGFNYDVLFANELRLGLSSDANYANSQITDAASTPNGRSPAHTLIDATIRLEKPDRWELALIGLNLTDKYYWTESTDATLEGPAFYPGTKLADTIAVPNRGREVMVRVTVKMK